MESQQQMQEAPNDYVKRKYISNLSHVLELNEVQIGDYLSFKVKLIIIEKCVGLMKITCLEKSHIT